MNLFWVSDQSNNNTQFHVKNVPCNCQVAKGKENNVDNAISFGDIIFCVSVLWRHSLASYLMNIHLPMTPKIYK